MGSSDPRPGAGAVSEQDAARVPARMAGGNFDGGWMQALGLQLERATAEGVAAHFRVDARHLQPAGIVHGGVYASVVETCCSIGAWLAAPQGQHVVGVENHTSFLRPIREGWLRAQARPLHAGRRAQLWECSIEDDAQRLVATGRLRLMVVDPGNKETKSSGSQR